MIFEQYYYRSFERTLAPNPLKKPPPKEPFIKNPLNLSAL
jgi:hypothetical protein